MYMSCFIASRVAIVLFFFVFIYVLLPFSGCSITARRCLNMFLLPG